MFSYEDANRMYEYVMDVLVRDYYSEEELRKAEVLLSKALKEVQGK